MATLDSIQPISSPQVKKMYPLLLKLEKVNMCTMQPRFSPMVRSSAPVASSASSAPMATLAALGTGVTAKYGACVTKGNPGDGNLSRLDAACQTNFPTPFALAKPFLQSIITKNSGANACVAIYNPSTLGSDKYPITQLGGPTAACGF